MKDSFNIVQVETIYWQFFVLSNHVITCTVFGSYKLLHVRNVCTCFFPRIFISTKSHIFIFVQNICFEKYEIFHSCDEITNTHRYNIFYKMKSINIQLEFYL